MASKVRSYKLQCERPRQDIVYRLGGLKTPEATPRMATMLLKTPKIRNEFGESVEHLTLMDPPCPLNCHSMRSEVLGLLSKSDKLGGERDRLFYFDC